MVFFVLAVKPSISYFMVLSIGLRYVDNCQFDKVDYDSMEFRLSQRV